jgi:hypothetical protein
MYGADMDDDEIVRNGKRFLGEGKEYGELIGRVKKHKRLDTCLCTATVASLRRD